MDIGADSPDFERKRVMGGSVNLHESDLSVAENGVDAGVQRNGSDEFLRAVSASLPSSYELERGLVYKLTAQNKRKAICAPLLLRNSARMADGTGYCVELAFLAVDGAVQTRVVDLSDLFERSSATVARLVERGFVLHGSAKDVCDLVQAMDKGSFIEAVDETGWVGPAGDCFITPAGACITRDSTIAKRLFRGVPVVRGAQVGEPEEWIRTVVGATPVEAVLVGLCAAFAPIVLSVTTNPSFLLHLRGEERISRLACFVAASVWGPPAQLQLSWSASLRDILDRIRVSRDSVVILTGYRARHHAKLVAVMEALAAMDAASAGRRVVLSSGADCVATAVSKGPAVSEIQNIVDLDIRDWKEGDTGVIAAASAQYGCLGPFIVRSALRWGIAGRETFLHIRCDKIRDTLGRDETSNKIYTGLDAETHSVSDAFGALFAAGAVIAREKMFGNRDWARDFYTKLFGDWVNQNRGNLGTEERALLGEIAGLIRNALRDDSLTPLAVSEGIVPADVPGWQDEHHIYLSAAMMDSLAAQAEKSTAVLIQLLIAQDLLRPGNERGHKFRLPSRVPGRPRAYRVSRDIIQFADAADSG